MNISIYIKKVILICLIAAICVSLFGCEITEPEETSLTSSEDTSQEESSAPSSGLHHTDVNGLYTFGEPIQTDLNFSFKTGNDFFLYQYTQGGMDRASSNYIVKDLYTGEELWNFSVEDDSIVSIFGKQGIYKVQFSEQKILFFDKNGNSNGSSDLPHIAPCPWVYTTPETMQLLYPGEDGFICLYDYKFEQIPLSQTIYATEVLGYTEQSYLVASTDSTIYSITTDGEVTALPTGLNVKFNAPYLVEFDRTGYGFRKPSESFYHYFPADTENESICNAAPNLLIAQKENSLHVYDLENQRVSQWISFPSIEQTLFLDEKHLAVLTGEFGNHVLYVLMLDTLKYDETIVISDTHVNALQFAIFKEPTGDETLLSLVDHMYQEYSIRVFFEPIDEEAEIMFYTCKPGNESTRYEYLSYVDDYLKLLPQGMLQEMSEGIDIWLYFTDLISGEKNGDDRDIEGFACQYMGHPLVVLEDGKPKNDFAIHVAHEFAHLFDSHISSEWLEGWDALNPKDSYYNSYFADNTDDFIVGYAPKEETYFIRDYAKSSADEDRAVTVETLYSSYLIGDLRYEFKDYPNIYAKAKYYCEMLRANFDTCHKEEILVWETYLDRLGK